MRAVVEWIKSLERGEKIRANLPAFKEVFCNVFRHITTNFQISETIVHLGLMIYIFQIPYFSVDRTDLITRRSSPHDIDDVGRKVGSFVDEMIGYCRSASRSDFEELVANKDFIHTTEEECKSVALLNYIVQEAKSRKLRVSSVSQATSLHLFNRVMPSSGVVGNYVFLIRGYRSSWKTELNHRSKIAPRFLIDKVEEQCKNVLNSYEEQWAFATTEYLDQFRCDSGSCQGWVGR
jgi:hypothetical protein